MSFIVDKIFRRSEKIPEPIQFIINKSEQIVSMMVYNDTLKLKSNPDKLCKVINENTRIYLANSKDPGLLSAEEIETASHSILHDVLIHLRTRSPVSVDGKFTTDFGYDYPVIFHENAKWAIEKGMLTEDDVKGLDHQIYEELKGFR